MIEYSNLKNVLAKKFPNDINSYIDGKTDFILDILKKEGIKNSETELIENENKKPTHSNI
ncbi:GrpB family protein [Aquimarina sp. MMG016]|nr:GrpB family protein [Aquimarina sp. MMG016]